MKYITKQEPPESFVRYSNKKGSNYENLSTNQFVVKEELRTSLLKEQGYICCYCGAKISRQTAIIEHLKSKRYNQHLRLNYNNLLASCNGGQRKRNKCADAKRKKLIHPPSCDNHKSDKEILVDPLMKDCESRFSFDELGNIYGEQDDVDAQKTITVLNLQSPVLVNQRKASIAAFSYLTNYSKEDWEKELNKLDELDNEGGYHPFCFAIKFYIKEYIIRSFSQI